MKKLSLIVSAATLLLAGCAKDVSLYVNDVSPSQGVSEEIVFGTRFKPVTRTDATGADAASLLNNRFVVTGAKGSLTDGVNTGMVFDNYDVVWTTNSAGTTQTNTSDWEYAGLPRNQFSGIVSNQTVKFWDYGNSRYDFIAYSAGFASVTADDPAAGQLQLTAVDPENAATAAYSVTGNISDLVKFYIADMVTVTKESLNPLPRFGNEVQLKFRNLSSKVRLALYETVPGYSVTDVVFYKSDETTTATATLYGNSGAAFFNNGTFTVYYPTAGTDNINDADFNKAHVKFTANAGGTSADKAFSSLGNLVGPESGEPAGNYLGRDAAHASYTTSDPNEDKAYQLVLPNEGGSTLHLKVNYKLVATDGSGEVINVTGASAVLPIQYGKWLPGYAYTYLFKIAKNTNGYTGPTSDPAGLFPITFDAVVVNDQEGLQETITTVADPSITTYQQGVQVVDEHISALDIYLMVNGADAAGLTANGKLFQIVQAGNEGISETSVSDALNIGSVEYPAGTVTGRNGMQLVLQESEVVSSFPGSDGNAIAADAAKFNLDAGIYAYTYMQSDGADGFLATAVKPEAGTPLRWYKATTSGSTLVPDNALADGEADYFWPTGSSLALTTSLADYYHDLDCSLPATYGNNVKYYYHKTAITLDAGSSLAYNKYHDADCTQPADYGNGVLQFWHKNGEVVADGTSLVGYFHDAAEQHPAYLGNGLNSYYHLVYEVVGYGYSLSNYFWDEDRTKPANKADGTTEFYHYAVAAVGDNFNFDAALAADPDDKYYYYQNYVYEQATGISSAGVTYYKIEPDVPVAGTSLSSYYRDAACTQSAQLGNGTLSFYTSKSEDVADAESLDGYFHDADLTQPAYLGNGTLLFFNDTEDAAQVTPDATTYLDPMFYFHDESCTLPANWSKAGTTYYTVVGATPGTDESLATYWWDFACTKPATEGNGATVFWKRNLADPKLPAGTVLKWNYANKEDCEYTGDDNSFKSGQADGNTYYYQRVPNKNDKYAVKVIKVQ